MKINKSGWLIGGIILLVLLVFSILWLSPFSSETLTEEELKATALTKYPGEIIHSVKKDNELEIEMQMDNGVYTIRMDAINGNILSLEQTRPEEVTAATKLTEGQIKTKIATQGELQSIQYIDHVDIPYYEAIVQKKNMEITLKVDPINGEILDAIEAPLEVAEPEESTLLSEQEALTIAADHLKGHADDVELHQPSGQIPYYLVEVEIENGENDREAIVQVDAYTGAVKSVNWED